MYIDCRVSTDEQAESGTSIDNQTEKNLAYAQANNMQVVALFKEDYTGRVLDRPELNKVREMLRRGQADNLIVYKPNRLDRSEWGLNTLLLMQELKTLGVNLHYAQDNRRIDLSNPMEVFMYGSFGGWQAGEDYAETVKKLYEGRIARAKAGYVVPHGGKYPYGYKVVKDSHKRWYFEIDESEATIVHLIFNWYVIGDETGKTLNLSQIADRLNKMGIHPRKSKVWKPAAIFAVIKNETYAGIWYYGRRSRDRRRPTAESVLVSVPAIIDRELWEAAQIRLQENKATAARNRKPGRYLLANRVTCGCCGFKMVGRVSVSESGGKSYRYLFYYCKNHYAIGRYDHYCDLPLFRADIVDQKVWEWLEEIANDTPRLLAGLQGYNERQQSKLEPIRRELALVEATLTDNNQKLDNAIASLKFLTDDLARAIHGAEIDALAAIIKNLKTEKAKLTAQLEVSTFRPEQAIGITAFMVGVAKNIQTLRESEARGVDLPELKIAVYEGKRAVLAWLDIQVKLFVLDGEKKAEVTAKVCPEGKVLSLDLGNTRIA